MLYLLANIVLSSSFILCVKWVHTRKDDVIDVGMVNYIVAGLVGGLLLMCEPIASSREAVGCGLLNGVCYFVAFFLLRQAVAFNGAAIMAVLSRLSILLPLLVGIAVWGERPGLGQTTGIALACLALTLIGRREPTRARTPPSVIAYMVLFFLIAGGSRLAQEMFKYVAAPDQRPGFLFAAFGSTAVAAIIVQVIRRRRPERAAWTIGALLGLANIGQTFFILKALEYYPGFIVFPVTSAGGLTLTAVVAVAWLKEKLNAWSWLGIGLASAALVLLQPGR